jgi:hypothetical protein
MGEPRGKGESAPIPGARARFGWAARRLSFQVRSGRWDGDGRLHAHATRAELGPAGCVAAESCLRRPASPHLWIPALPSVTDGGCTAEGSGHHWAWGGSVILGVGLGLWLSNPAYHIGFAALLQQFVALMTDGILAWVYPRAFGSAIQCGGGDGVI